MPRRAIILHSGAGGTRFTSQDKRFKHLRLAVEIGMTAMKKGSSLDAVEAAVNYMEDCGMFNAGRGACLTAEGSIQLDAAIMEGETGRGAGVALCECTYNPVSLARVAMEKTEHVLLAGRACERLARAEGSKIASLRPSAAALQRFKIEKAGMQTNHPKDYRVLRSMIEHREMMGGSTVGAVAIDQDGVPAAAVSTGGIWMKLPGRIGDSAIIGAGIYADKASGAACATGRGEEIIKCVLCWNACAFMKENGNAIYGARRSIALITRRSGTGMAGVITVDLKGRVGFAYNTETMGRAWYDTAKGRVLVDS